jgi:ATP-dependent helicase/nuclease subunit A
VRDLDSILIVDYKTNRPPPKEVAKVAEAYLLQLAAYRLAIGHIFSQQRVRAAILWTDGPRIMEIPADMLDAAEQRLWQPSPADP